MLHYVKGDLTSATEQVIVHGVNCMGKFGKGVAASISSRHPFIRKKYLDLKEHVLGSCQFIEYDGRIWVNAHTQQNIGYDGKQYADLTAIGYCFSEIADYMDDHGLRSIAMPKIGCGLGGLDWDQVNILADGLFEDHEVYIYELE